MTNIRALMQKVTRLERLPGIAEPLDIMVRCFTMTAGQVEQANDAVRARNEGARLCRVRYVREVFEDCDLSSLPTGAPWPEHSPEATAAEAALTAHHLQQRSRLMYGEPEGGGS